VLRVTVTRENATEVRPIGEVVIGKFAGTEQRGGYAARVYEPPSAFSEGIDACFTVRGHDRYQPAMALVASVLAAWREGRIDQVGDGVRAALANTARPSAPPAEAPLTIQEMQETLALIATGTGPRADAATAAAELLKNVLFLATSIINAGEPAAPGPR
jgi:hypothetical protein